MQVDNEILSSILEERNPEKAESDKLQPETEQVNYQQVAGFIDLRTTYSDGAHDLNFLIKLTKERGFDVLFINDHDRMAMEYGIFAFRNILRKREELS